MEEFIFIHGWINKYIIEKDKDIKEFYEELLNKLKEYFEVHFIVLPGFSNNPEPERPYELNDYVEYLKKYVEEKNINKFYLMGHSFGGQIVIKFTHLYPEKVEKLILYAPACIRRKSIRQKILNFFKPIGKIIFTICPFLKKLTYKLLTGSTSYLKLSYTMKETMKNIMNEDLTDILPKIEKETLILWGKKDKITPLSHGKLINKLIKNSKIIIEEKGDHSFHKNNPDFIVNSIKDFISS